MGESAETPELPAGKGSDHGENNLPCPWVGGFDSWLLLLFWRWLNLWTILAVVTLSFAGFWWLARARLVNPRIHARMEFAAAFISIHNPDPMAARLEVTKHLKDFQSRISEFDFHPTQFKGKRSEVPYNEQFIDTAVALATSKDGSYEQQCAVNQFNLFAATWYDDVDPAGQLYWPNFASDEQLRKGSDVSLPLGSYSDLRDDAEQFLRDGKLFEGNWTSASTQVRLRPWRLIRFYDPKRYLLSETLPYAMGTLLLACSLFLGMRFIDYAKSRKYRVKIFCTPAFTVAKVQWTRLPLPKSAIPAWKWPNIWSNSIRSTIDSNDRGIVSLHLSICSLVTQLFPHRQLKIWVPLAVALALFIEFELDTPGIRLEWWINAPFISLAGVALVVLLNTLCHLALSRFEHTGIGVASREFRSRVLRPFFIGTFTLLAVTAWMVDYSITVLPLGVAERIREVVQVCLSVCTLGLMAWLTWHLWQQLNALPAGVPWKITTDEEEALHFADSGLVDAVLPNIDDNMRRALLLAIVPLGSILGTLFS